VAITGRQVHIVTCWKAATWKTKKDMRRKHKDGTSGEETEMIGGG
jgi:hypothetical protein